MPPPPDPNNPLPDATQLLHDLQAGDGKASEALLPLIYDELHKIAASLMRAERDDHTLQPTALVNEAYMRLIHSGGPPPDGASGADEQSFDSRVHFLRVAARAMRNVLVDHARAHRAQKRGGKDRAKITLDEGLVLDGGDADSLLNVEETLQKLHDLDPQLGQIVELRFFGGLKDKEIGVALSVSERTVQRGWRTARAFLSKEMGTGDK